MQTRPSKMIFFLTKVLSLCLSSTDKQYALNALSTLLLQANSPFLPRCQTILTIYNFPQSIPRSITVLICNAMQLIFQLTKSSEEFFILVTQNVHF